MYGYHQPSRLYLVEPDLKLNPLGDQGHIYTLLFLGFLGEHNMIIPITKANDTKHFVGQMR